MEKGTLVQQPPERDKSRLFLVNKVAEATGVSRATILRMEERGLLTPAYVSPSGLRYYDNYNLSRIMEVQHLQAMGFSNEEAALYFSSGGDAEAMFALVEKKLRMLQQTYEEMKLRATTDKHLSVQLCEIGEGWYYVEHADGVGIQDKYNITYDAFRHCVQKGYRLAAGSLMTVNHRTDYLDGRSDPAPYPFDSCIPVQPGQEGPELVHFPACLALVLTYCGELSEIEEAYLHLGAEVRGRGLTPAGFVRADAVVGPPIGRDVDMNKYRCRLILPVGDTAERKQT